MSPDPEIREATQQGAAEAKNKPVSKHGPKLDMDSGQPIDGQTLILAPKGADGGTIASEREVRVLVVPDPEKYAKAVRKKFPSLKVELVTLPSGNGPEPSGGVDESGGVSRNADNDGGAADPPTNDRWTETARFRCLGYDRGTYYYLPRGTGQILSLGASSHRREQLLQLAPLSWWEQHFPGKNGPQWHVAADAMFRVCERSGVFRPERLRGRGCWPVEGADGNKKILLHLGDRLLPPGGGRYVDPESYHDPSGRIYERLSRLSGPSRKKALDDGGAQKVLDLFTDLKWMDEASGHLLAGWTVLAPICGALKWRPHVWIIGGAGAGKTEVQSRLVVPLLAGQADVGGFCRYYEGGSTEAGVRQELRADALPVVYDEGEKTDARSDARVQSVLALARSSSTESGSHVAKGTTHGQAMSFQVRSMFCLASIAGAIRQEADKTRISLLQLHSKGTLSDAERRRHWSKYSPRLAEVTPELGRKLISRTLGWLRDGRLGQTIITFQQAGAQVLGDARSGDQYGTLAAGAWTLTAPKPPSADEAKHTLEAMGLEPYVEEQEPEGMKALRILLQQEARVEVSPPKTYAVGELVEMAKPGSMSSDHDVAKEWLKRQGLKVEQGGRNEYRLLIANKSEWVKKALRNTPYRDNFRNALRTLEGVEAGEKPVWFHSGIVSRVTEVPLGVLATGDEEKA